MDLELKDFADKEKLSLENEVFQDIIIGDLEYKQIEIKNCVFKNIVIEKMGDREIEIEECVFEDVVFNNFIEDAPESYIDIKNCTFKKCEFHSKFKNILLLLDKNIYYECIFEDVIIYGYTEQYGITDCKFKKCKMNNIEIEGEVEIAQIEICNCDICNFVYNGTQFWLNHICDVQASNIQLNGWISRNIFENIKGENIELNGEVSGEERSNKYINCELCNFCTEEFI